MSITVNDGTLILKDPSDVSTYTFDWDDALATSVTIASITCGVVALGGDTTTTPLTLSTASPLGIQSGSRTVKVQLTAGAVGSKWRVNCKVVTSETPAQTRERSFFLKLEQM